MPSWDDCPKCGGRKRSKNNQCADCRGYGRKRHVTKAGYVRIYEPDHPLANSDGYVLEHRKVMHDLGRCIPSGMHIHHRDGDKQNNDPRNLMILLPKEHATYSSRYLPPIRCATCGDPFKPDNRKRRFCSRACSNQRSVI